MIRAGVIGWPITHSRSPLIHGHWLARYGIPGRYDRIAVEPAEAARWFAGLSESGLAGCNVTLPHKAAAYAAAAEREASAEAVGVANTLWLADGRLQAANTDTYGFMRHLDTSAPRWREGSGLVAVLGAGGAARAIVFGLLEAGVERVVIYNRTRERAEAIADHFGARVRVGDWSQRSAELADVSVLVNTSALGMKGQPPLEIDLAGMRAGGVVADIVYVPLETPLLAAARRRDLTAVDGLGMLLHQAVPGFERWFGVRPEVTDELRAILVADIEVA
jgi:shikimate dehydrogenase